jgi:PAS domain S-box-containing protein
LRESERFNRATLDALGANLAVLDERGLILATNKAWREFAEANATDWHGVSEGTNYLAVCEKAAARGNQDAAKTLNGIREVMADMRQTWVHEYPCHSPSEKRWFYCRVTRFPGDGPVRVVVAHENITAQKEYEHEVIRLSRLYAALSHVNQAIISLHDREELFGEICRVLVEFGGFRMAWVGWLDVETRQIRPVGQSGDSTSYLSQMKVYADDRPEGHGPTGTAIREERNYICNDFNHDPRTLPWRKAAEQAHFRASAVLVIRQGGVVCGAITVYADETDFFHAKEIQLLEEVACDVSFALDNLKREEARQQAEEASRRSELELKEAQRVARVGSWWLAAGSNEVVWTDELYHILGLDPAQPPPPYPEQHRLFTPESWQRLSATIPRTMETGELYELELEMIRSDGSQGWMLARGERLQDARGAILGLRGVAQDITQRKRIEVALETSKKRLRDIIDGVGPSMFVGLMTPQGVLIEANLSALTAAGLKLEDVLGKPFEETYWWAYSPEVQAQLRLAIARGERGEASRYDVRVRVAADKFADVDFSLQPLRDETGEVAFLIPSASVITDRKQAEEELLKKTALLEAQVDSSLDGILVVDDQGKRILQNQRMSDVWKIPPEVSANIDDAVQIEFVTKRTKDPRQFVDKVAYLYAHPDEVSRDEIELIDGTVLDRYASPVRDKAGKYYGRIWTFRDITEHRQLEFQIRQSQKMESIGSWPVVSLMISTTLLA